MIKSIAYLLLSCIFASQMLYAKKLHIVVDVEGTLAQPIPKALKSTVPESLLMVSGKRQLRLKNYALQALKKISEDPNVEISFVSTKYDTDTLRALLNSIPGDIKPVSLSKSIKGNDYLGDRIDLRKLDSKTENIVYVGNSDSEVRQRNRFLAGGREIYAYPSFKAAQESELKSGKRSFYPQSEEEWSRDSDKWIAIYYALKQQAVNHKLGKSDIISFDADDFISKGKEDLTDPYKAFETKIKIEWSTKYEKVTGCRAKFVDSKKVVNFESLDQCRKILKTKITWEVPSLRVNCIEYAVLPGESVAIQKLPGNRLCFTEEEKEYYRARDKFKAFCNATNDCSHRVLGDPARETITATLEALRTLTKKQIAAKSIYDRMQELAISISEHEQKVIDKDVDSMKQVHNLIREGEKVLASCFELDIGFPIAAETPHSEILNFKNGYQKAISNIRAKAEAYGEITGKDLALVNKSYSSCAASIFKSGEMRFSRVSQGCEVIATQELQYQLFSRMIKKELDKTPWLKPEAKRSTLKTILNKLNENDYCGESWFYAREKKSIRPSQVERRARSSRSYYDYMGSCQGQFMEELRDVKFATIALKQGKLRFGFKTDFESALKEAHNNDCAKGKKVQECVQKYIEQKFLLSKALDLAKLPSFTEKFKNKSLARYHAQRFLFESIRPCMNKKWSVNPKEQEITDCLDGIKEYAAKIKTGKYQIVPEIMALKFGETVPRSLYKKYSANDIAYTLVQWQHQNSPSAKFDGSNYYDYHINGRVQKAFHPSVIQYILPSKTDYPCFKNLHQVGRGDGCECPSDRADAENKFLGLKLSDRYIKDKDNPVNYVRPKYAFWGLDNPPDTKYNRTYFSGQYGNIFAVFHQYVNQRVTFTPGDSLTSKYYNREIRTSHFKSSSRINGRGSYYEAQLWGEACLEDVEHFLVNCPTHKSVDSSYIRQLVDTGIPVYNCKVQNRKRGYGTKLIKGDRIY